MKRAGAVAAIAFLSGAPALPAAAAQEGATEPPGAHQTSEHSAEAEDPSLAKWKLVNFILLAGAIGWVLYKKGGTFFASRTVAIRRGLDEATRMRKDAEARYAEIERQLANVGGEIEALRKQAREESAAEGERVRGETEREMKKIRAQVEQEIAAAAKSARQELRAFSAELAISLAGQRIREQLTPEQDGALVRAAAGELASRFGDRAARIS